MKKMYFLLLISAFGHAQINAVIKDSITGEKISFAAITNPKLKIEMACGAEGYFEILDHDTATINIHRVGYFPKKVKIQGLRNSIVMRPKPVPDQPKVALTGTKQARTGRVRREISRFSKGIMYDMPTVVAKYFPYKEKYEKTPYVNTVSYCISSESNNIIYRLRVFDVNPDGSPGDDLLSDDLLIAAEKGQSTVDADFSEKGIRIGPGGIFVGIEVIAVAQNSTVLKHKPKNPLTAEDRELPHKFFQPAFLGDAKNTGTLWLFQDGKWVHRTEKISHDSPSGRFYELNSPYIELTLTN